MKKTFKKTMQEIAKDFFDGGWRTSEKSLFMDVWGDVITDNGIEEIFEYIQKWESK